MMDMDTWKLVGEQLKYSSADSHIRWLEHQCFRHQLCLHLQGSHMT
jgi:hypothetical protein